MGYCGNIISMNDNVKNAIYSAHYDPGTASKYVARGITSAAVWIVIILLLAFFLISFKLEFAVWMVIGGISLAAPVLISIHAAMKSKKKYSTDDGLAIAITKHGVVLPGRDLIQWHNIVGLREGGTGVATGNISVYLFTVWLGTRETRLIEIYVNGGVKEIDQLASNPNLDSKLIDTVGRGGTRSEPWKGYRVKSSYVQGLGDKLFNEALDAATSAAHSQGIPTSWR
jgi:hypothetical protein